MTGTIKALQLEKGFGFLRPSGGEKTDELFFHCSQLIGLDWDQTLMERRVVFDEGFDQRSGRRRAVNIRAKED